MSFSWFISVDDHLIEPARLWQERLPERWREPGPRIVREGAAAAASAWPRCAPAAAWPPP